MARWFRWYEGTTEDGKFRAAARMSRVTVRDVIALWAFILEDAANLEHRGVCRRDEDFMAAILDFDPGQPETILEAMQSLGMISVGPQTITVCNWDKRQFESDRDTTAVDRQRRKRERDKGVTNAHVTRDQNACNAPQIQSTDTDKKDNAPSALGFEDEFEGFWRAYPKKADRGHALLAFRAARKRGVSLDVLTAGAERYRADPHRKPEFTKNGATWLKGECWRDEAAENSNGASKITPQEREANRLAAYAHLIKRKVSPGQSFTAQDRFKLIQQGLVTMSECEAAGCAA